MLGRTWPQTLTVKSGSSECETSVQENGLKDQYAEAVFFIHLFERSRLGISKTLVQQLGYRIWPIDYVEETSWCPWTLGIATAQIRRL